MRGDDGRGLGPLHLILAAIALLAIAVPLFVVALAPRTSGPLPLAITVAERVVPPAQIPEVEPVALQAVSPEDARTFNAAVPIVGGPNPAARAYSFGFGEEARARATDCLAAAVYYEAGDDAVGQRAVAQVILNRMRHPAFPKTVCGVVFQGSERSTGCQFTFTCDGALARYTPSSVAWERAQQVAAAALTGSVYKPVGYATHYHTDWVVPYWSASLDKIAKVGTHLFFRWTGWWGTPPAFGRAPQPGEPIEPQLARLSPAHGTGAVLTQEGAIIPSAPFFGRGLTATASDPNMFLTTLDTAQEAGFPAMAAQACGDRSRCTFMGWTDPSAMAFAFPMSGEQMNAMSFSYLRDRAANLERTLWNCTEFRQRSGKQCMKRQSLRIEAPVAAPPDEPAADAVRGPEDLSGVRRKPAPVGDAAPAETPAPDRPDRSRPAPARPE